MWRPINLIKKPFFFPEPKEIYFEKKDNLNIKTRDKYLALWEVKKLKIK